MCSVLTFDCLHESFCFKSSHNCENAYAIPGKKGLQGVVLILNTIARNRVALDSGKTDVYFPNGGRCYLDIGPDCV